VIGALFPAANYPNESTFVISSLIEVSIAIAAKLNMRKANAHTDAGRRPESMLEQLSRDRGTEDRRRQRKIGIAGICAWTIVLSIVVIRAYFKKPKPYLRFH
jgi:hypothetical protein